jgi:hypothetical protein
VGIAGADPGDAADSFLFVGDADHRWHWGRYIFLSLYFLSNIFVTLLLIFRL